MNSSILRTAAIGGTTVIAIGAAAIALTSNSLGNSFLTPEIREQLVAPVEVTRDIPYGSDELQVFDLYHRETYEAAPVVLLVHGGDQDEGDKSKVTSRISTYTDLGFIVANTNFRYEEIGLEYDIACALSNLVSIAPSYGGDTSQFLVHGYSLGGSITSRMIYDDTVDWLEGCNSQEPFTVAGYYGESTHFGNIIPDDVEPTFGFLGKEITGPADYLETQEDIYNDNKTDKSGVIARDGAINYVDSEDPPALLIVGSEDPKNDEQRQEDFAAALNAAGVNTYTHVVQGGDHGLRNDKRPGVTRLIQRFANHIMRGTDFNWE